MCNSYMQDTYNVIVPPDIAMKALTEAGDVYLRECPCRIKKGNCKQDDKEICLLFGDASEEELKGAHLIPKDQAVSILERTRKRGDINQLFYKKDTKRYTEICSCCTCCCSILEDMEKKGDFTHFKSSGYLVKTDPDTCTLCGECLGQCFFGARSITDDTLILDEKLCFGCERCTSTCPEEAITLIHDSGIKIPEEL